MSRDYRRHARSAAQELDSDGFPSLWLGGNPSRASGLRREAADTGMAILVMRRVRCCAGTVVPSLGRGRSAGAAIVTRNFAMKSKVLLIAAVLIEVALIVYLARVRLTPAGAITLMVISALALGTACYRMKRGLTT